MQLTPEFESGAALHKLKCWCHEHISNDIHYQGTEEEQYKQYFILAKNYLDHFIAEAVPENAYNMNKIQCAAFEGFHYYLDTLSVESEQWNSATSTGMTPLHLAAVQGHVNTVKTLLAKTANPLIENNNKQLPIQSALFVPILHDSDLIANKEKIFNELAAQAPNSITHQDNGGDSLLHLMAIHGFDSLAKQSLEKNEQLAFCRNNFSRYPIHTAILNHQIAIVRLLLEIAKVNMLADSQGRKPLHYAAMYGQKEMVALCCEHSDINMKDYANKTPLHLAIEANNIAAIPVLLAKGADVTLIDFENKTALSLAEEKGSEPIKQMILDYARQR